MVAAADAQLLGEVGHGRRAPGAQGAQDQLMSSFCQHARAATRHLQSFPCYLLHASCQFLRRAAHDLRMPQT